MVKVSTKRGLAGALLMGILAFSAPLAAQQSSVFVRNQPVVIDASSGGVSVIHFFALLDSDERSKLRLQGPALIVIDNQGTEHRMPLTEDRKLVNWQDALGFLGYDKKVNSETGVVDFALPATGDVNGAGSASNQDTPEERLARSMRRPGYRNAKANYEKLIKQIGLSPDETARQRVRRLGRIIASNSPLSGLEWNFDIIDTPIPNALCTGEGHVLVTSGLLDLDLTDDELAGVLGHEVAHGVRRHAEIYEERYQEFMVLRRLYMELLSESRKDPDQQNVAKLRRLKSEFEGKQKRMDFLLDYLKNKRDYDQDEEEEADVLGMQYAVAAGFDSEGESRALKKLQARSVQMFGQSYDDGTRTHPPLARRLQILQTVRNRWRK